MTFSTGTNEDITLTPPSLHNPQHMPIPSSYPRPRSPVKLVLASIPSYHPFSPISFSTFHFSRETNPAQRHGRRGRQREFWVLREEITGRQCVVVTVVFVSLVSPSVRGHVFARCREPSNWNCVPRPEGVCACAFACTCTCASVWFGFMKL